MKRNVMCIAWGVAALALAQFVLLAAPAHATDYQADEAQNPPFHIAGNLYYVGSVGHGAYLLPTPKGSILVNCDYQDSPPLVRQSVEKLGFKWSDIKIILISHAHGDHAGGCAQIAKETGATYSVMQGDVETIQSGGKADDYSHGDGPLEIYPPAKVDHVLHDGEKVELGGTVLTAHLTAGHTKGTTTWTFDETEGGKLLHVVIMGGPTLVKGMKVDNPKYPTIVADYEKEFALLRSLPCDIPLGAHDWYFDLGPKYKRLISGDKNAFIDPPGYIAFIDKSQQAFERLLQRQKAAAQKGTKPAGD